MKPWVMAVVLVAIVVLLLVDLIDKPSTGVHVTLELAAASIAAVAFVWLWGAYVRRALG